MEDPTFTPICKLVGEIQKQITTTRSQATQKTYFGTVVTYDILDRLRGDEVAKTVIQRQGMALQTGEGSQDSGRFLKHHSGSPRKRTYPHSGRDAQGKAVKGVVSEGTLEEKGALDSI